MKEKKREKKGKKRKRKRKKKSRVESSGGVCPWSLHFLSSTS